MTVETRKESGVTRRHLLEGTGSLALVGVLAAGTAAASDQETGSLLEQALVEMRFTRNFLAKWFAGAIQKPEDPADFYLNRVLAKNFNIVRPNGVPLNREQTLAGFYGKLHGSDPMVLRHDNDNINPLLDTAAVAVVGYDESHVYQDHTVINALTAVFLNDNTAPNGVRWLLVHETPIEAG